MPPVGFETTILARERPQTHALDRTATGIGRYVYSRPKPFSVSWDLNIHTYKKKSPTWYSSQGH
jgi:hypothetical protein